MWRGEVQDLLSQISQLQAENKRLLQTLPLNDPPIPEEESEKQEGGLSVAYPLESDFSFKIFIHFLLCDDSKHVCLQLRISIWVLSIL